MRKSAHDSGSPIPAAISTLPPKGGSHEKWVGSPTTANPSAASTAHAKRLTTMYFTGKRKYRSAGEQAAGQRIERRIPAEGRDEKHQADHEPERVRGGTARRDRTAASSGTSGPT